MQGTIGVYRWKDFDSFVRKVLKLKSRISSNEVLDSVAQDLITGKLRARNKLGHPLKLSVLVKKSNRLLFASFGFDG